MKMLPLLALLSGCATLLHAQIAKTDQLPALLKNASLDSVQKTERLTAILFHEKINAYRVANNKNALGWDDTLWLAARNHDLWMVANDELSHDEKAGTKAFTGDGPGKRYDFVTGGKGTCSWSGENALYNYAVGKGTIAENAEALADYCFNQWKKSPGHNENMLRAGSRVHGVAFICSTDGRAWATDVFGIVSSDYVMVSKPAAIPGAVFSAPATVVAAASPQPVTAPTSATASATKSKPGKFVSASAKYVKLDLEETNSNLQSALYSTAGMKKSKPLSKAAQHHAEYMATNQKVAHDEKKKRRKYYAGSPQQRIAKASRAARFFKKRSVEYVESIAMVQADAATLDISALSKSVLEALDKEKATAEGTTTAVGFGTVIKRIKNELRIYVVREEKSSH